jgi:L-serine dehydratase
MKTSIFDLFKIGIGPSSSHTVGPMKAAREFASCLDKDGTLDKVWSIRIELFGSLGLTGIGHGTDRAVILGLQGERPEEVNPDRIESLIETVLRESSLNVLGKRKIEFRVADHLQFHRNRALPTHPNAMQFTAFDVAGTILAQEVYFSIGGGFIQKQGAQEETEAQRRCPPFPFSSAQELVESAQGAKLPVWAIILENEKTLRDEIEIRLRVQQLWQVMRECIERGARTDGILPGGLNVRRRAPRLFSKLQGSASRDPFNGMDWVNAFAMAVNEENAAGGRVVTAPTNGAAGVIPAVIRYYEQLVEGASDEGIFHFFLTAGAIGVLFKENASISGAEVGCQGEVGVACSMAAAGLVAALGGSNDQIENAAEIGMEHHLGMTCDPIGGLVQIPCIERNAIGAVKAINACRMAMQSDGGHKVSLDQVIKTMYETGLDMQARYKETSLGGLAVNVIEC